MPDRPGVPIDSAQSNPRRLHYFSGDTGGAHIGVCMEPPAADGRIYLIARRHRYFYGFALAWFDPATYATGAFKDDGAFNHYQIGWMALIDGGRKLAITTYVQYNKQLPGTAPESAALFIFDVKEQKITGKYIPLADCRALLGVVQTAPDQLVGTAVAPDGNSSVLYRFNLRTGKTEQTRPYPGLICGTPRGDLGVPVRTSDFLVGPDGLIWAGAEADAGRTMIVRFEPGDLSDHPAGTVSGKNIRLLFNGGQLYISGAPTVRRVKDYPFGGGAGKASRPLSSRAGLAGE